MIEYFKPLHCTAVIWGSIIIPKWKLFCCFFLTSKENNLFKKYFKYEKSLLINNNCLFLHACGRSIPSASCSKAILVTTKSLVLRLYDRFPIPYKVQWYTWEIFITFMICRCFVPPLEQVWWSREDVQESSDAEPCGAERAREPRHARTQETRFCQQILAHCLTF